MASLRPAGPSQPAPRRHPFRPLWVALAGGLAAAWITFGLLESWSGQGRGGWEAVRRTAHWIPTIASHLPRNSGTVLWVTALVAAMILPGCVWLRIFHVSWESRLEHAIFAVSMGLAGWVPWTLAIGWTLGLHRATTVVSTSSYLVISIAALAYLDRTNLERRLRSLAVPRSRPSVAWVDLVLVIFICGLGYVSLLGALSPEVQFDARWYHLGSAAHYVSHGNFYNLVASTHDPAMGLNPYQEILYTGFYSLGGAVAAKVFAFLDLPLIAIAMVAFGRVHLRSSRQGLIAAAILFAIPIASWSGSTASNDLPVALYSLLAVHMLLRWRRQAEQWSLAYLALFLAAFSCGVKSLGVFTLGACLLVIVVEALRLKAIPNGRAAILIVGWSSTAIIAACATWWIRTAAMTADPVFPVAYKIFPTPYWNQYSNSTGFGTYRHISLAHIPIGFVHSLLTTVTLPGPYQVVMGPLFLVSVPIVIAVVCLSARRPTPEWLTLGLFGLIWSLCWYIGGFSTSRYLVAVMPVACLWIVAGLKHGLSYPKLGRLAAIVGSIGVLIVSLATTQIFVPLQRGSTTPGDEGVIPYAWEYLYHGASAASVQLDYLPMIQYIDAHIGGTRSKIYDAGGLYSAYMYLTPEMYDGSTYGSPEVMRQWSFSSPDALKQLRSHRIGYVVLQAAAVPMLEHEPIYNHLVKMHESPDSLILYRIND